MAGGREVAQPLPVLGAQTQELSDRFGQARENVGTEFARAEQDLASVLQGQRQLALQDFAAQQEGARSQALANLPPELRQSGVGQSALNQADRASQANLANVQRGLGQANLQAQQGLIGGELESLLNLDQAGIQAFLQDIGSVRAAQAGVAGAKLASDTAASTGGLFGHGGFLGTGL